MKRIFDFHTHPFVNDAGNLCAHRDVIPMSREDIRPLFDRLGVGRIAGSVLLWDRSQPIWENLAACNNIALELREYFGEFYYPGFHIHPDHPAESLAELRRFADLGFRLVGELVPYFHGWSDYSSPAFDYLLDACREHGMVVNLHAQGEDEMDAMVRKHPDVTLVMAHPGEYPDYMRHLGRMDMSENYYLDLSGTGLFRQGMLARGIREKGAERFLFGSDYPTCNPAMFVGGVTLDPLISPEEQEKILRTNGERLLGLI